MLFRSLVKFTALDGLGLNLETTVIEDACAPIDPHYGGAAEAIEEMKAAGVRFASSQSIFLGKR